MFSHLPVEILLAIGEQLTNPRDVKTLCEISTYLNKVFTPLLYEQLILWPRLEDGLDLLDEIEVEPLLRTRNTANNILRYTKSIEFASTFRFNTRDRCIYTEECHSEEGDIDELPENLTNVLSLLECCRDDSLRDFTWTMGTCIPARLLGHLSRKQKSIESLVLITNGACAYNYDSTHETDISAFPCLRNLSWVGIRSIGDMKALKATLKHVSHQLVVLELDFINKDKVKETLFLDHHEFDNDESDNDESDNDGSDNDESDNDESDNDEFENFFSHHILDLPSVSTTQMFPAVRVVYFSDMSLGSTAQNIADAFDWGSLISLTLRFCEGWEDFLLRGSVSSCSIGLTSLNLQFSPCEEIDAENTIATFLRSFQGLEDLSISHGSPTFTLVIWDALLHHKATLTTIVHHPRGLHDEADVENSRESDSDSVSPHLSLPSKEMVTWSKDMAEQPLSGLHLKFLGIYCHPELLLTRVLKPLTRNTSIRILHLRQSCHDLLDSLPANDPRHEEENDDGYCIRKLKRSFQDLAQWAFGSEGLLSLEVIALGDFSYGGRYAETQLVFVRNAGQGECKHCVNGITFRQILPVDSRQKDLIENWDDFLAACPSTRILDD
ncbi:hypothetical protein FB567DRAFT_541451 [Paraphoma chrysanthemicola]|uniref:Uncharacterized protein n=1 Tax=Paraphoma chrysanthemicola TaxID=798071 RepID=A0A8K0VS70_9PLEO|nr:hypothetical protein FB567DRAFT_541451 [Paraphoma chrysanthemicola]